MNLRQLIHARGLVLLLLLATILSGCVSAPPALTPPDVASQQQAYSGRFAITVTEGSDFPAQRQTGGFEAQLQHNKHHLLAARVSLFAPLGNRIASLQSQRQPASAVLDTPQQQFTAATIQDVMAKAMGLGVPLDTFFEWLLFQRKTDTDWQLSIDSQHPTGAPRTVKASYGKPANIVVLLVLDPPNE